MTMTELFITLSILFIAALCRQWLGKAKAARKNSAPTQRPLWMGPDLIETTEAIRKAIFRRLQEAGQTVPERSMVSDELAQHHAHAMAAGGFCSSTDPEGESLDGRLRRLHPNFVGTLAEWNRALGGAGSHNSGSLAENLLNGPGADGRSLFEAMAKAPFNLLGLGLAGNSQRVILCVILADHWATQLDVPPLLEREGCWAVTAELAAGTTASELCAALVTADGVVGNSSPPAVTMGDGKQQQRICAYPERITDLSNTSVQWSRGSVAAIRIPLP